MKTIVKWNFRLSSATFIIIVLFIFTEFFSGCNLIFDLPDFEGHIPITEQETYFEYDTSANPAPARVAVYKTEFNGPAYRITYNYGHIDEIIPQGAIWGSEEDYDMAYFKWLNDSTVTIRLYNSETGAKEEFKLYGLPSSNGSGMEILDPEEVKGQPAGEHLVE
jgi:hypothetical protein